MLHIIHFPCVYIGQRILNLTEVVIILFHLLHTQLPGI